MKLIAFYGTLMRAFDVQKLLGFDAELRFVAPCRIPGELYDLGDYPGLVEGGGEVVGEVFELLGERTLARLDDFEEYNPAEPRASEYIRRAMRLKEPDLDAWVYVYNRPVEPTQLIGAGEWTYSEERAEKILKRVRYALGR